MRSRAHRARPRSFQTEQRNDFLSDRQVPMALAQRAALIQGHRLTKLLPFTKEQIHRWIGIAHGPESRA
ncbi:hypothetical protein BE20_23630 [Sorangium cellulosum]|nr:hypothetical protein BE20_23630 [Sorangium cellulosum]